MKSKIFIIVFLFINSILYADIINTKSFNNGDISTQNYSTPRIVQRILSPDNEFTALNENREFIIIVNRANKIIFKFKWNDEAEAFPTSDTVYILNWSNTKNVLWFLTWIPAEAAYVAKADIDSKTLTLYSTSTSNIVMEYVVDTDNNLFYYSNYRHFEADDDPDEIMSLFSYNLITKEEKLIISRKRKEGKFVPRIANGVIEYNE